MAITDYNTNPDLNTAISSIGIAEGCPPGNVNNALRQIMADIRAFYDTSGGGRVSFATTTVRGIVELATSAEASAGKDTERAVTPSGLKAAIAANPSASTAKLTTARTIGLSGLATGTATAFDGTKNITIPVTAVSSASTAARLATARSISLSGGVTGTATAFDGSKNITIPVTGLNMGNATAGTLAAARGGTGRTDGKVAALATARNISLSGGATGTATPFDGTKNIAIPVTGLNMSYATAGVLPPARGGTGNTLGAAPVPKAATGVGQWVYKETTHVPSGGTWAYFYLIISKGYESGVFQDVHTGGGVAAGGTRIARTSVNGIFWRIS